MAAISYLFITTFVVPFPCRPSGMTLDQCSRSPHPAAPATIAPSPTGSLRPSRSCRPRSLSPRLISSFRRSTRGCAVSSDPFLSVFPMTSSARRGGSSSHPPTLRGPTPPTPSQRSRPKQSATATLASLLPKPYLRKFQPQLHLPSHQVEAPSEAHPPLQSQQHHPRNSF